MGDVVGSAPRTAFAKEFGIAHFIRKYEQFLTQKSRRNALKDRGLIRTQAINEDSSLARPIFERIIGIEAFKRRAGASVVVINGSGTRGEIVVRRLRLIQQEAQLIVLDD